MSEDITPTKRSRSSASAAAKKGNSRSAQGVNIPDAPDPQLLSKAQRIASQLQELYPDPPIPLDHGSNFQLLVAVILSAQSTDKKVNEITPELFKVGPDAQRMAQLPLQDIERLIKAIGLAPTKARNISAMSKMLMEQHAGQVGRSTPPPTTTGAPA
jgi:hypothetical protein